ncbi:hypothetical protein NDU88_002091 [Pleurodeles waltl]|uniref:Uncharacterized protein n=1 Tax=Pleurodeles waltl TaxID=8319 RepID=A0AAV7LF45_PLEWA|nr:hypothetical protein NDU88_002091 [Pleurodeles waltl]
MVCTGDVSGLNQKDPVICEQCVRASLHIGDLEINCILEWPISKETNWRRGRVIRCVLARSPVGVHRHRSVP